MVEKARRRRCAENDADLPALSFLDKGQRLPRHHSPLRKNRLWGVPCPTTSRRIAVEFSSKKQKKAV